MDHILKPRRYRSRPPTASGGPHHAQKHPCTALTPGPRLCGKIHPFSVSRGHPGSGHIFGLPQSEQGRGEGFTWIFVLFSGLHLAVIRVYFW